MLQELQIQTDRGMLILTLTPHTESNLTRIADLNVKSKMIKLSEENIQEYLHNLEAGKDFLGKEKKE